VTGVICDVSEEVHGSLKSVAVERQKSASGMALGPVHRGSNGAVAPVGTR
jgi:hypothetical protein